jgi:hypothetical protein
VVRLARGSKKRNVQVVSRVRSSSRLRPRPFSKSSNPTSPKNLRVFPVDNRHSGETLFYHSIDYNPQGFIRIRFDHARFHEFADWTMQNRVTFLVYMLADFGASEGPDHPPVAIHDGTNR